MIEIMYGKNFLSSVQKIPKAQQKKLDVLLERMAQNPFDPLLHTKKLTSALSGFWSFRITRDWRVIFQFLDPECIQLILTKHRKDIYR